MRNFIIYFFLALGLWSCDSKKSSFFTLDGTIENIEDSTEVSLSYLTQHNGKWKEVSNTTYLINGKFYFEGNIDELTAAYVVYEDIDILLYMEPTAMKMAIDKANPYVYEFSGTSVEKESTELRNLLADNMIIRGTIRDSIHKIFSQRDLCPDEPTILDSLMQRAYHFKAENIINSKNLDNLRIDFIVKHNAYQITPHVIYTLSRDNLISNDTIVALYNSLPEHSKVTLLGRLTLAQIKENELSLDKKDLIIGDTAPDFSRKTMQGEIINLSDFRDKSYVLLDFWASWCGPCLKEVPQLKKIQDTYSDKGLTIIGVSSDADEQQWRKTIEEYKMGRWIHVIGYTDSRDYFEKADDISVIYNIQTIPVYILLDKQGKILAKWQHIGDNEIGFIDKLFR